MRRFLFAICVISYFTAFSQQYVLHCGTIVITEFATSADNQSIYISDGKIERIESGFTQDDGYETVDLKNALVMPGLIDMHVHLEAILGKNSYLNRFKKNKEDLALDGAYYARLTLESGFTTVRDLGGTGANVALKSAIRRGRVPVPRILTSRKTISITGGHGDASNGLRLDLAGESDAHDGIVDSPDAAAKAVRWQVKNGADWIKITATGGVLSLAKDGDGPAFNEEELRVIVETATDRGVQVAAHAHGKEGMLRAIRAGVKTIEHGTYADQEVFTLMKEKNCYLVPTITAGWSVADSARIDGFFPDVVRPKAARIGALIETTFGKAYQAGVPIAFGTDAGVFPHGKNGLEFYFMERAGMPLLECIQSATYTHAQLLGLSDEIGQLKEGFQADIVAMPIESLEDPMVMTQPLAVMKSGVFYAR